MKIYPLSQHKDPYTITSLIIRAYTKKHKHKKKMISMIIPYPTKKTQIKKENHKPMIILYPNIIKG